jgi:large conductance mechanosensitive channel
MGVIKEFRDFAMRGNVVDMAVGVIIGGAFGAVVGSLVQDVMMPPLGYLMSGADFAEMSLKITPPQTGDEPPVPVEIKYGVFINAIIKFVIVAFALFMVIQAMNRLKKKEEAKPAAPPAPTKEEVLLTEIRDLLAAKR